ncbi:MAG: HIT domain-containing protein [Candidatus Promineifilaceae bacterium]
MIFTLARSPIGRRLTGWLFTHMSFAIPVHRLRETDTLMAFHHPRPAYPIHILLVPKRPISTLTDLTPADTDFLTDLVSTVQSLIAEFDLESKGYRLITNGGPYQDIPHLHFHLISEEKTAVG